MRYIVVLPKGQEVTGEVRSDIIRALAGEKTEFESEGKEWSIWTLDVNDTPAEEAPAPEVEAAPEPAPPEG